MADQAGYSPSFKRPSEIMRMRRKRARLTSAESPGQSDSSPPGVRPFSPGPLLHPRTGGPVKRRNPFASLENTYSPQKKLVIYKDDGGVEAVDRKMKEEGGGGDMSRRTLDGGWGHKVGVHRLLLVRHDILSDHNDVLCPTEELL